MRKFLLGALVCWLACAFPVDAKELAPLQLPKGARLGVVSLLDAEVVHFHVARQIQDGFLKTHAVNWPVDLMLEDALKERAGQMGVVLVPVSSPQGLQHSREDCFLNGAFVKGLPKECVVPLTRVMNAEHLDALIVLAPGTNSYGHAAGSRRKELPEYLRGWGILTDETAAAQGARPELFALTEMLLVAPSPGGPTLNGRNWGGDYPLQWKDFSAPAQWRDISSQQIDQLQPVFAGVLARQAARVLEQIRVAP